MKTGYYGCGGYISKGTSVCQRSIVRQRAIEEFIFEEIALGIKQFVEGDEGRKVLRKALIELLGPDDSGADKQRRRLLSKKNELEGKIYNILDNITPTTREFADKRMAQLKGDLATIQAELDSLDEANARRVNIDRLIPHLLEYMGSIGKVVAEGTVEEKRRFLQAFVTKVELDPESGTGRAELYDLPRFGVDVAG